jgi:fatty-acyl-CoA synthase
MGPLLTMGEALGVNARLYPDKPGACDLSRSMTFREWNERACRLANALLGLGLAKGDRVAMLAYNCVEWLEFYAATAKAGLVAVPINFRLVGSEIQYIVDDCEAAAFIVQHDLRERIDGTRANLPIIDARYICFGGPTPAGFSSYEELMARSSADEPLVSIAPEEAFAVIYTSGTTGKPKGALRSHASHALLNFATLLDMGLSRTDRCLLVMPLCHANSINFASIFSYCGACCCVYDARSFDPEHLLRTLAAQKATFTSLVPTHLVMVLGLSDDARSRHDVEHVTKLLVSSAPARKDTKLAIMEAFRGADLFELYGSTEQGWATLLRPDEQLTKLGSVGREFTGSGRIKLLNDAGDEVPDGEVGELYSRTPWCFEGYWKLPDKTAEAFRGAYLSVGDMARRDEDGFYSLVDRKNNVIISGGENVYPTEVENLLSSHPMVKDVAVIGRPDDKWGEAVHAVVVVRDGATATEADILAWCATRIAGYKRPKSVSFISDDAMPRTATGKILHRVLKSRFTQG